MGLEVADFIDGLDKTWPLQGDPVGQGDDHVRLLKHTIKNTFPGEAGAGFEKAIIATEDELNFVSGVTSSIQDQIDANFNKYLDGHLVTGEHMEYVGDLDDIFQNSNYQVAVTNVTNLPAGVTGNLFVTTDVLDTTFALQMCYGHTGNSKYKIWMRQNATGSLWEEWKLVADGGAFTERLAGYRDDLTHDASVDDLDTILTNSVYLVSASAVNAPSDYTLSNRGFIETLMTSASSTLGTQFLYGREGNNQYKVWMRTLSTTWGAWKLVVDGGAFTERLDGFLDTGIHLQYTADLDLILWNSTYSFDSATVTNEPSDMTVSGMVTTDTHYAGTLYAVQTIVGSLGADNNKVWMRQRDNGVWGAWIKVVDGNMLTFLTNGVQISADDNAIITSQGFNGYGSFQAVGSGTNPTYIFFRDSISERARISVQDEIMGFHIGAAAARIAGVTESGIFSDQAPIDANHLTRKDYVDSAIAAVMPAGTLMLFQQTAAPTGWTKQTSHNNKAFRVVSGAAGSGGSVAFTTAFSNQNVSNTSLTIAQMPAHSHSYGSNSSVNGANNAFGTSTVNNADQNGIIRSEGGGASHNHGINLAVQYVDIIIAVKA